MLIHQEKAGIKPFYPLAEAKDKSLFAQDSNVSYATYLKGVIIVRPKNKIQNGIVRINTKVVL